MPTTRSSRALWWTLLTIFDILLTQNGQRNQTVAGAAAAFSATRQHNLQSRCVNLPPILVGKLSKTWTCAVNLWHFVISKSAANIRQSNYCRSCFNHHRRSSKTFCATTCHFWLKTLLALPTARLRLSRMLKNVSESSRRKMKMKTKFRWNRLWSSHVWGVRCGGLFWMVR